MRRLLLCLFLARSLQAQAQPAGACKVDGSDCSVKTLNSLAGDVTLAAGSNVTITPSGNTLTVASTAGGSGTVTSVGNGTVSALFTASWATPTTTPAFSFAFANQAGTGSAGCFFGSPAGGSSGAITCRVLVANDVPTLNQSTSGNAATVTTNANLTGPITSTGNATAVAAQTGTGSTFVMQASPTRSSDTGDTSAVRWLCAGTP